VDKIEKQLEEYPPAVLFDRMIRIADEVKYLKRALWGVVFSVVTAVIIYLLTLRLGVEIQPR
jgi:hypothetical protein